MRFRPVIRVFVSSTFTDLKAERNILQSKVFTSLEHYCLLRGFQFQAIDLRWGVPGEAGLDHRTMQICFDELRRAQEVSPRPNFLVLLGDRYGWQPLAEVVTKAEFQKLEKAAKKLDDEASRGKKATKTVTQVLNTWYRRDDNAVPPEYVLRSRKEWRGGQHFNGKREKEKWAKVEAVLWAVINRAYPPERLADRFDRIPALDQPLPSIVKFQTSATEQEIWRGGLAVPDAREHVVAWYRTIRNRSDYRDDERAKDFFDPNDALHRAAGELKDELNRKLHGKGKKGIKPVEVDLRPSADGKKLEVTVDHIETMCSEIEGKLRRIINKEIRKYWRPTAGGSVEPQPPVGVTGPSEARKLELERLAHRQFGEARAPKGRFVGREKELKTIARYITDENDDKPLVVYGPSGTGKTALLARAAQRATKSGRRIFVRFLGTTPGSSNLQSLLMNLCRALRLPEEVEKPVPVELRGLQDEFDKLLASATLKKPIVLFLDALDQLDEADGARQTYWLRTPLPPHVKVVVSCIYDPNGPKELNEPYLAFERRKLLEDEDGQRRSIAVQSLPPDEAMELLDRWLEHADIKRTLKRRLTKSQREAIEKHIANGEAADRRRPLYLRLLFEQCRLWPSYREKVTTDELGKNTAGLLQCLFERLSQPTNHGRILVESVLGYVIAARRGLSENEILEVLWADPDYKQHLETQTEKTKHQLPPEATRIPIAIWSRLRHDLDPYLAEHAAPGGAVLNFYHREVSRVVNDHFLSKPAHGILRHDRLAEYFQSEQQPSWREVDYQQLATVTSQKRLPNARRVSELPWQLLRVADASDPERSQPTAWDAAVTLLCDIGFVEAKCAAGLVFELQEDYRDARRMLPEAQGDLRADEACEAETARWTKEIFEYARQWNQRRDRIQRGERVDETEPVLPAIPATCRMWTQEEIEAECQRIRGMPTRLDRLAGFAGFVEGECYPLVQFGGREGFTLQHAINYAPGGAVHDAARGMLQQCGAPLLLHRWQKEAKWNPKPALLRTLEGHSGWINSVSATPDARRAVSGSGGFRAPKWDSTLRVWNLASGACLRTLEGNSEAVESVCVTPDGRRALSGSRDNTLSVWDLESGASLRTLEGHGGWVTSVSLTPDGRRAVSGGDDKTLRMWDLESGRCLRKLEGHSDPICSVSVTPDGRRAVSGGRDETLRVWDLDTGACLRVLQGHSDWVTSVSLTPDGRRAVSGSGDKTVRVWDLETGASLRKMEGHADEVTNVSVTSDGRLAVSASWDETVRLWDVESGACLRTLGGHSLWVLSAGVTPDGRRAVSGGADKTVRLWDLEAGASMRAMGILFSGWSISMMPDGRRAISGSRDNTLVVWELETGASLRTLEGHREWVDSVSVTPDGRRAVSASYDRTVRVWDLESGTCLHTLEGDGGRVRSVSVTPDGRRAVSGSYDRTVRVWDLESGVCLHTFGGPGGEFIGSGAGVWSVTVTPDGRRAVSGGDDKRLRMWDLESGRCLRKLEGHSDTIYSVSVGPDGRLAVSGSRDNTLRVWDLESGRCLRKLEGHSDRVNTVSVTPDGRRAVSGSGDKTVRVWDLPRGDCLGIFVAAAPVMAVAILSGLLTIGTNAGDLLIIEMRNFLPVPEITPAIRPDPSDAAYEALLRRGLDRSRREKGSTHEETISHLKALAVHLEKIGRTDEARRLHEEHNRRAQERKSVEMSSELMERRKAALQAYQTGDYAHAEHLLRSLIADGPSTHCHLSLVFLIQDRFTEAATEVSAAWGQRAELLPYFVSDPVQFHHRRYVIRLILWLQLALLYISQTRDEGMQTERNRATLANLAHSGGDAPLILGRLKTTLADKGAGFSRWTMEPVLTHLRLKLRAEHYDLLAALVAVLNGVENNAALGEFSAWREATVQPLD